ncbi:MAG: DUF2326 domain-containing protein, partial [Planctomycetota bacterium]
EAKIEELKSSKTTAEALSGAEVDEYDKLVGTIQLKSDEAAELREAVDQFQFSQAEFDIKQELVQNLEVEISDLNDRLYTVDFEISKLEDTLSRRLSFDLDAVEQLFREADSIFPDAIKKSYQELIRFNQKINEDRGTRLREQLQSLQEERGVLQVRHRKLDEERRDNLQAIQGTDAFEKFKYHQSRLAKLEVDIARSQAQVEILDEATGFIKDMRSLQLERSNLIDAIAEIVRNGSELYSEIKKEFNRMLNAIIEINALISIVVNGEGNLEFDASLLHRGDGEDVSMEGRGTSYMQLMCCIFDLTLLMTRRSSGFFRFVYHDGVFEGLDNRKKLKLLDVIRNVTGEHGLQYILTTIDADMPRDASGAIVPFDDANIVLELHDEGDDGRLFKMPRF